GQLVAHGGRVRPDGRRELDEALEDLRLDALARRADDPREARPDVERPGVDEEQLLLDAERPRLGAPEPEALGFVSHFPRTPCTGRPDASHAQSGALGP